MYVHKPWRGMYVMYAYICVTVKHLTATLLHRVWCACRAYNNQIQTVANGPQWTIMLINGPEKPAAVPQMLAHRRLSNTETVQMLLPSTHTTKSGSKPCAK